MSTTETALIPGYYYHIYNRGVNKNPIFFEAHNYIYFLQLINRFLLEYADIFVYCLLKNHFHLLIRINEINHDKPHLGLSHTFNSYTQSINKAYHRSGPLFERPFRRKLIDKPNYLFHIVCYIHLNPIHHKISSEFINYPYSSYNAIISKEATQLQRGTILDWFGGRDNFIETHYNWQYDQKFCDFFIEG